jgi:hypothetical protein
MALTMSSLWFLAVTIGHHDDGQLVGRIILAQHLQGIKAADFRHLDIQEH